MSLIMDQMHLRLAQLEEGKRRTVSNDNNNNDDEDGGCENDKSLKSCHKDEKQPKSLL